ncbi:uncharacterized protein L201_007959 [Kwoniella dendrophila CBS 6074]|uniref:Uncharacterized protein n=1 Tax=Kwoniella dendrophila CBS 6074 TaxID=1295534 RepID=A0AAX4K5Z4_9TREE
MKDEIFVNLKSLLLIFRKSYKEDVEAFYNSGGWQGTKERASRNFSDWLPAFIPKNGPLQFKVQKDFRDEERYYHEQKYFREILNTISVDLYWFMTHWPNIRTFCVPRGDRHLGTPKALPHVIYIQTDQWFASHNQAVPKRYLNDLFIDRLKQAQQERLDSGLITPLVWEFF